MTNLGKLCQSAPLTSSTINGADYPAPSKGGIMPCFKPLKALDYGYGSNGKKKIEILTKSMSYENVCPKRTHNYLMSQARKAKLINLPCGKCIGCRLEYSKQWAMRCMAEAGQFKHNAFITLTYDPEYLPVNESLIPEHLTKFMKDLRRYWEHHYKHEGIRFFACGEYGPLYGRPHFHIAVFNIEIGDKKVWKLDKGEILYISETIAKIWGKGFITIGDVTWNSAAYVARYVTKKIKGPHAKDFYAEIGKVPEFTRMSRRPGIGHGVYEQFKQDYENAEYLVKTKKGVQALKPCRYYDKLYDLEQPDHLRRVREAREKKAEMRDMMIRAKTSADEFQYRRTCEENLEQRIKVLDRNMDDDVH